MWKGNLENSIHEVRSGEAFSVLDISEAFYGKKRLVRDGIKQGTFS
jgi:hypothetical protein